MSNTNESSGNASNNITKGLKLSLNDSDDRYAFVKLSSGKEDVNKSLVLIQYHTLEG